MNDEIKNNPQQKGDTIDFMALFSSLWKHRKLYYKVLGITFVLALYLCFSRFQKSTSVR